MARVLAAIVSCFLFVSAAQAWTHGLFTGRDNQLNVGGDLLGGNFINVLKMTSVTFANAVDAGLMDAEGYPNGTPTGDIFVTGLITGTVYSGVQYKLVVDAGITFPDAGTGKGLRNLSSMTACTYTGVVTSTACGGVGTTISTTGSGGGSITFTMTNQITLRWLAGTAVSHTLGAKISLYRFTDEADFIAGEYFTPEYRALLSSPSPTNTASLLSTEGSCIRTMGWTQRSQNYNSELKWAHRIKLESFSWATKQIIPAVWAGAIAGTDTYTATAPDSDQIVGVIANTNTIAGATLNGIPIKQWNGDALTVGLLTVGLATFTKDSMLGTYMYNNGGGGIVPSIPVEVQVQLANRTNRCLWPTVPPRVDDDYVTNYADKLCNTTNSNVLLVPEYTNEDWLFNWPQTGWSRYRGIALGFPDTSNRTYNGWYGLRFREIMGNLFPTACGSNISRVKPYLAANATNDTTMPPYRMRGQDLASVANGGQGNALFVSYTGDANYTTLGNRPMDVAYSTGQAPYTGGTNICFAADFNCSATTTQLPFYQCLINATEGGDTSSCAVTNPTVSSHTPLNLVDDDVRQGRELVQSVTCSGTTCTTPLAHGYVTNTTQVQFQVVGGTMYSGLSAPQLYRVSSTPTSTTFTIQAYDATGLPAGANVNAGSVGTGAVSVGSNRQRRNLQSMANIYERFMEDTAASFDADRVTLGKPPLQVRWYEGNLEFLGPTAAQCLTIGIVTNPPDATGALCAAEIAAAIASYVADARATAAVQTYYNRFMGTDATFPVTFGLMPHSKAPSWLIMMCDTRYQLLSGCLPSATPNAFGLGYQSWSRGGWLLKRDLDPASNDNDPMWLNKAA